MDSVWRQNLVFVILETPPILYLALAYHIQMLLAAEFGPRAAYAFFWVLFAVVGMLTLFVAFGFRQSGLSYVAGREFLVGYKRRFDKHADDIQLELGPHAKLDVEVDDPDIEIGGVRMGDVEFYTVYGNKDVINYVLISPGPLGKVLDTADKTYIDAGWWIVKGKAYHVVLYEPETRVVDVMRQQLGLEQSVPVYIIREAPGLLKVWDFTAEEAGKLAEKARDAVDALRSKQLMAENLALRQELESLMNARDTVDDLATDKAMAFIQAHLENRKVPKPRVLRLDKWFWIFLIVVILVLFGLYVFGKWFALQQASAPPVRAPTNTTAGGGG